MFCDVNLGKHFFFRFDAVSKWTSKSFYAII